MQLSSRTFALSCLSFSVVIVVVEHVDCVSLYKRTERPLFDFNRLPSPDIQEDGVTVDNHLASNSQPSNSRLINKKKRKQTDLSSYTVEEKRLRRKELDKIRHEAEKKAYENRFNFPSNSEERMAIEKQFERKRQRRRVYHNKYYHSLRQNAKSDNPDQEKLKVWNSRRMTSTLIKKHRRQRVRNGTATANDLEKIKNIEKYQKGYRKTHREQVNLYSVNHRARQKANKHAKK